MKIQPSDFLLLRIAGWGQPFFRWLGDRETAFLRPDLSSIKIVKPVFITGLARAGTTILLELFSNVEGFSSHRYRDFPFLMTPYIWNRYLDLASTSQEPVERAHQDRIRITRESPEAFEEPLWQAFFPRAHLASADHRLDESTRNPEFERFFQDHIRKLLFIRKGSRYISKGNYNVSRIEYLARVFPDARFVVAIRHPMTHVHSLVRQHRLFSDYTALDARVPRYLAAAGHFEFGPQRVPIRFDTEQENRVLDAWSRGEEYLGYAIQWAEVYRFVDMLRRTAPHIADRMLVVRYEDFCDDPANTVQTVLKHIHVGEGKALKVFARLDEISKSEHRPRINQATRAKLVEEVDSVARVFGYDTQAG